MAGVVPGDLEREALKASLVCLAPGGLNAWPAHWEHVVEEPAHFMADRKQREGTQGQVRARTRSK